MKKFFTLSLFSLFFLLLTGSSVQAQRTLGILNDNYAGASSMFYQPASIVDSRLKFDMEIMGFSAYAGNDFISIDRSVARDLLRYPDTIRSLEFYNQKVSENFDGKNKNFFLESDVKLVNVMMPINEKNAFGFGVRIRAVGNVSNIDEDALALFFRKGNDPIRLNVPISYDNASQRFMVWNEYSFTYARVLMDEQEHFLKGGATLKLLQGIGAIYVYEENLGYEFITEDIALNVDADIKVGISGNLDDIRNDLQNYRFTSKPGFGFDFGFVYEWRPKWKDYKYDMDGKYDLWRRDQNKYKLRVGVSVLDIGKINFDKQHGINDIAFHDNLIDTEGWTFDNFPQDVFDTLNNRYGVDGAEQSFDMILPTSANIAIDYHIIKGLYTSLTGRLAFNQGTKKYAKVNTIHNITLTPRYEMKRFGAYLPLQINQITGFNFGVGARIGPVYFGSPDLLSILGLQKDINKLGAYIGFKIPILYDAPKDRDGDGVSDKKDKCPKDKGPWEFEGCPDSDGDGIPNKDDDCAYTAGKAEFKGCPDTDGDGVQDKFDECPEVAGAKIHKGCPDTDEDGVIDKMDSCMTVVGLKEFHGCPDTDNDMIPDHLDDCPDVKGLEAFNGCPDTDGDGIQDALDLCPDVAGLDSLQGCPYVDSDGDGLRDERDNCPTLAGPIENGGCPYADTDNDSVPDNLDLCPLTPGPVSNNGCPEIEEEEQEILNTAFANLEFETGKAVIKASSYTSLDELVELFNKKPEFKLLIEGHTDNVGRPAANLYLSQNRALAVKNYLVNKGIKGDRLNAKWYGEEKPLESNDTEEGRQKNRRVEMTVIFD